MQVFLPFDDTGRSLEVLDGLRLRKQRVEAYQIIQIIEKIKNTDTKVAWSNHPATQMYVDYLPYLKNYYNRSLIVNADRGGQNIKLQPIHLDREDVNNFKLPKHFGNQEFHLSHQSNLLRKAVNDSNGIGTAGKPKKPSTELLERLAKVGINRSNTPIDVPYYWG